MRTLLALLAMLLFVSGSGGIRAADAAAVEQWGIAEQQFTGPKEGNPFVDVQLTATFRQGTESLTVTGFYDGDGIYRVRFMPPKPGDWTFTTQSNRPELSGKTGTITASKPSPKNHGPVRVRNQYHFGYADGTPYFPIGTTCYAWTHLGDTIEAQTIEALKKAPFNKVRMCIFPKWYTYNKREPLLYPYEGTPPKKWDLTRFNPAFFRHIEARIAELRDLGIEADLILFHPYDTGHWGFDRMPADADDLYIRYVVARFGAFRNVWWSLANEFDFMKGKTDADWERFLNLMAKSDPYAHLRSIHNGTRLFNQNHKLLTHASIQNGSAVSDFGRAVLYRDAFEKPIVFDEVKYEGDLEQRWGNLSAEEMVHRCWQGTIAGTYVGHGETYKSSDDMIWWSKGGKLRGQSPSRIAFLRKVIEDGPQEGLEPIDKWQDDHTAGKKGEYYLIYLGKEKPTAWPVQLPQAGVKGNLNVTIELLDTWDCTVTPIRGTYTLKPVGKYSFVADPPTSIPLPGKPYQALRIRVTR